MSLKMTGFPGNSKTKCLSCYPRPIAGCTRHLQTHFPPRTNRLVFAWRFGPCCDSMAFIFPPTTVARPSTPPVFRVLALWGICWVASQPEDRLVELSTIGARIAE